MSILTKMLTVQLTQYSMTNHIMHHMAFQPIYPFITQLRSNNTILPVSILRRQNTHEGEAWVHLLSQ